jgi:hypothetical protein
MSGRRSWDRGIYPEGLGQPNPEMEENPGYLPEPPVRVRQFDPQPKRLLDAHDNLIGRQALITTNRDAGIGDLGRGIPTSLLKLTADSRLGEVVTVTLCAFDPRNFENGAVEAAEPGVPVGIIRFGNGGGMAEVEIDIPNPDTHSHGVNYAASGTTISIPAGHIEVLARDDGRVIPGAGQTPVIANGVFGGHLVSAHVTYGDRGSPGKIYRSLPFAWNSQATGGGNAVILRVPAFARNVQIVRYPKQAVDVYFFMGGTAGGGPFVFDRVSLAADANSLIYPIPPRVTQVRIENVGPGAITSGWAVFEIAL